MGLNRTSVGLKLGDTVVYAKWKGSLNRTSVGLKQTKGQINCLIRRRLNRTSVGLKPKRGRNFLAARKLPQSNQRGIETIVNATPVLAFESASIEPAWD